MYLKVEFDGESEFYAFENQSVVAIGRGPESDIQILTEGVSRNHITIKEENGEYSFKDNGSTNGTFLNGQKIESEEVHPFNSFFPLKLGANVYIHLIDEITAKNMLKDGIVPKNRQGYSKGIDGQGASAKTESLHYYGGSENNPNETRIIKRISIDTNTNTDRDSHKNSKALLLGVFALIASVIYLMPTDDKTIPEAKTADIEPKAATVAQESGTKNNRLTTQEAKSMIGLDKCLGDFEAQLCAPIKKMRTMSYAEGFLKISNKLFLILDYQMVSKFYSNEKYTDEELEKLDGLLRYKQGRTFSAQSLKEQDFRLGTIELDSVVEKRVSMFTDLARLNLANLVLSHSGIDEFYIILFNETPENYYAHALVGSEALNSLSNNDSVGFDFKIFWRSGYKEPASNYVDKLSGVRLKGF